MVVRSWMCALVTLALVAGCGGSDDTPVDDGAPDATADASADVSPEVAREAASDVSLDEAAVDAPEESAADAASEPAEADAHVCPAPTGPIGTCRDARPAGAPAPPAPRPYSLGTCPTLVPGRNVIRSSTIDRQFLLVLPTDYDHQEALPLVFLWHWLGGDANGFLTKGEVQAAADEQRFAAVIPEAKDDALNIFKWPFNIVELQPRIDEEVRFFDDMFACVTQQVVVNRDCVATAGVSAGALWTDQLVGIRGQYFSSFMSLSGGVGGVIRPWAEPTHALPAFVLWGGPADVCVTIPFQAESQLLEQALEVDCHFMVECVHNCAHAEPPFDTPPGMSKYAALWRFFLDHPYWLGPGQSPWLRDGLPAGTPPWCGIGPGSATMRTGTCPPPSCPI